MNYHFKKTIIKTSFNKLVLQLKGELYKEGFRILNEVNVQKIFAEDLKIGFRKFTIFNLYHSSFAHGMFMLEPFAPLIVPCNITIQEINIGEVEIIPFNSGELISGTIDNPSLQNLAEEISRRIDLVIQALVPMRKGIPDVILD